MSKLTNDIMIPNTEDYLFLTDSTEIWKQQNIFVPNTEKWRQIAFYPDKKTPYKNKNNSYFCRIYKKNLNIVIIH